MKARRVLFVVPKEFVHGAQVALKKVVAKKYALLILWWKSLKKRLAAADPRAPSSATKLHYRPLRLIDMKMLARS